MPSTRASVVSTSNVPRAGRITAASSPGPTTTHGGVARRDVIRAMSARSPREETVECRKNANAPLCRVGRSNEPAKAGGPAVIGRASGFLGSEACTTPGPADHFDGTLAQTSLRNHHEQSRSYRILAWGRGRVKARGLNRLLFQPFARVPGRRSARCESPAD
jgi:hypothetical protein